MRFRDSKSLPARPRVVAIGAALLCSTLALNAPAAAETGKPAIAKKRTGGSGLMIALPPVVHDGATPEAAPDLGQVVATFSPARPGREVALKRLTPDGWRPVATAEQDRTGSASFDVRSGTYRATTESTLRRTATTTNSVAAPTWQTTFEEEFAGSRLDTSVWNDQVREHEPLSRRTCARSSSAARQVGGGVLHLGVKKDPALTGQTCSYTDPAGAGTSDFLLHSQVATEFTQAFGHGTFAARMKLQKASGMHSAFWLLPENRNFVWGAPAKGTEIDVVEFFGQGRGDIGSYIHYYDPGWTGVKLGAKFPDATKVLAKGEKWWDEFHVFSVEWSPAGYVFRVDGREYHRETAAVSMTPEYLVLSMIPSDYELDLLSDDDLDDTAEVDWVRVYNSTMTVPAAPSLRTTFRSRLSRQ